MSETYKLSVIVPVYNVEEYLQECVDSILGQDYSSFELILVDDCSKDKSGIICDDYQKKDKRVKVIHHHRQMGHTAARQDGFRASVGDYILYVDSDDWIDEKMLSTMMEKAVNENVDIVQCSYRSVRDGKGKDEIPVYEEGLYDKQGLEEKIYPTFIYAGGYYRFGIAPSMCNKIYRRRLVETYLFRVDKSLRSGEDGLMTFSSFLAAERVWILHNCFYNYRSRAVSMCRIVDNKRLSENHLLFKYYKEWFWGNPVIEYQVKRFVVYQTLLAMEEMLKTMTLFKIEKTHSFLKEKGIERESIKEVGIFEIKGKRNRLTLLALKLTL